LLTIVPGKPRLVALGVYFCYRYADLILRRLGATGTSVVIRLTAFILLCIGVQICWNGIHSLIRSGFPAVTSGAASRPARLIVESHSGRLWATPNDGPGVTFSFQVPCEAEDAANGARGRRIFKEGEMPGSANSTAVHMSDL
jgi:hypothetical protein